MAGSSQLFKANRQYVVMAATRFISGSFGLSVGWAWGWGGGGSFCLFGSFDVFFLSPFQWGEGVMLFAHLCACVFTRVSSPAIARDALQGAIYSLFALVWSSFG